MMLSNRSQGIPFYSLLSSFASYKVTFQVLIIVATAVISYPSKKCTHWLTSLPKQVTTRDLKEKGKKKYFPPSFMIGIITEQFVAS